MRKSRFRRNALPSLWLGESGAVLFNEAATIAVVWEATLAQLTYNSNDATPERHAVFIHGLKRLGRKPWMSAASPSEFWPLWLADDIERLGVWTIDYDSAPTWWRGHSMTRVDRANNVLPLLLSDDRLAKGEIAFVAHSFGGLVVEQLLRVANERSSAEPKVKEFLSRINKIVFLGTPHRGADLASWGTRLSLVFRPSAAAEGLSRNDPDLRDLNQFYRGFSAQADIETQSIVETRPTKWFGLVVKPDSSDIGLPSAPIPVDADHFSVAAPDSKQSEIYVHILNHLKKAARPRTVIADPTLLQNIASSTAETSVAIARIEERLSKQDYTTAIPRELVDGEVDRRVWRIRKMRFLLGSTHLEESSQLVHALRDGELRAASNEVKANALAWSARVLLSKADRKEAIDTLQAALTLRRTESVSIAEAFADSYNGNISTALNKLSSLSSSDARAASFIIASNSKGAIDPLVWLSQAGFSTMEMAADGKVFLFQRYFENRRWEEAHLLARSLTEADLTEAPVLAYLAAHTHLLITAPRELRALLLQQLPFDAAVMPFADDAASTSERQRSIELYTKASEFALSLGCIRVSNDAADRALWLRLRDPSTRTNARVELEQSMRDSKHSLRRLPLAIQFGLRLDLEAVEREIDRKEALADGNSMEVALARFSLALTKASAREVAEYIARHRAKLSQHLNMPYLAAFEIQMLLDSKQTDAAEARLAELPTDNDANGEYAKLKRIVAEAKASNPVASREAEFKRTDSLADLASLVQRLEELSDWPRLVTYGGEYFKRTVGLTALRLFSQALYETKAYEELCSTLKAHPDLVRQSPFLEAIYAWGLFKQGDIDASRKVLSQLRSNRDDANDRTLYVHLALASGDWSSLGAFVEQEWERRSDRTAAELLRAGQIAQQIGSSRGQELIVEASERADDNPEIYLGCYGAAISAGWESSQTSLWLERAAQLSGEDGPVRKVAFKEIFESAPSWHERETRTWEQLKAGDLPIFAAGHLLNRTLLDLVLLPAIANAETADPRRRAMIYAYSGARRFFNGVGKVAAIDPTALISLAVLRYLEPAFNFFERIIIPRSTLTWLFRERERLKFHQPSRVQEAREIRGLLAAGKLTRFDRTAPIDAELVAEIGVDLAGMLAEAALPSDDGRQKLVVRSSPVHRVGSLMEEQADLTAFEGLLCSCDDIVTALVRSGQLTQAEEQKARAHLKLSEIPWPHPATIKAGAKLYLDGLTVSYFRHLGLLRKLHDAGFIGIVTDTDVSQSDWLITYEEFSQQALNTIEYLRNSISEGIASQKIQLAPWATDDGEQPNRLLDHPSFAITSAARLADVVIVDDRNLNQHGLFPTDFGSRSVWTTYDLLSFSLKQLPDLIERLTALRRAGFCFVPLRADELISLVKTAPVSENALVETAELKAIRENLLQARLSGSTQFPKERAWLDQTAFAFSEAIKAQWFDGVDAAEATARSNWLLTQFDVRHWPLSEQIATSLSAMNDRHMGFALLLATLNTGVKYKTKCLYWDWYETAVLRPIREEERSIYDAIVQQVRSMIAGAADAWAEDGGNGED